MKRIYVIMLLAAIIVPATSSFAVRYGVKKQLYVGSTGANPSYLAYSRASNTMYCGNASAGTVSYIDCTNDTLLGSVAPGGFMIGPMAYDSVNNRVHVKGMDQYTSIDCASNTTDTSFMGFQGGLHVAYNADNNTVYLGDDFNSQLLVYNATTHAFVTALTGWNGFTLYYPPSNSVYVPNNNPLGSKDSLGVFSGATNALATMISIPGLASSAGKGMAANAALGRLYVALDYSDRVAIVNTATNALLSSPAVGDNPVAFALCPINNLMFVACNGISQYSLRYVTILGTVDSVSTGDSVSTVVYNPKDSLIYIGCWQSGYVKLVDPRLPTPLVVDSVSTQYDAHFMDMAVDKGGDVYCALYNSDNIDVIGQIPKRMWRSATTSGSWNDYYSWQYSDDGGTFWNMAMIIATTPNCLTDSLITVQSGQAINITTAVLADQLQVEGVLNLQGGGLTVNDGPGEDMVVTGWFQRTGGALTVNSGAVMRCAAGSYYQHEIDGGNIAPCTWDPGATLEIDGIDSTAIASGMDQAFATIRWSCTGQSRDMTLPGGPGFSARQLSVDATGNTSALRLTSGALPRLNVAGDFSIGGSCRAILGGSGTHAMSVAGTFMVYDPAWFYLSDTLSRGIDTLYLAGAYRHDVSGIAGGGSDSTWIVFNGSAPQDYIDNVEQFRGHVNYLVAPGAALQIPEGARVGRGSLGDFVLRPGATLMIANMQGIYPTGQDTGAVQVLGTRTYSPGANYCYNGTQIGNTYVTGPGLPDTVRQFILDNIYSGVSLSKSVAVKDTLKLLSGALVIGGNRLSLYGPIFSTGGNLSGDSTSRLAVLGNTPDTLLISAGIAGLDTLELDRPAGADLGAPLPIYGAYVQRNGRIHSNWLQYGPSATLMYNRAGADTTADTEFPISNGPRNVTVNTGGTLQLHADRTVAGALTLPGVLATGSSTVTIDSGGVINRTGGFVSGNLQKLVGPSADTTVNYELGTPGRGYTPVALRFFNTSAPGFVSAGLAGVPQPNVSNAPACMRKYWSFSSAGITADSCLLTLNYSPLDFNPPNFTEAAHEATMAAGRYAHGATPGWYPAVITARNAGGTSDGGSVTLRHAALFGLNPDFTLGRDTMALWAGPDSSAPGAPLNPQANGANPSQWLNGSISAVAITWDNPADPSGIMRAYCKASVPPTNNLDFTDSFSTGIGGPSDTISIPVLAINGSVPLYVWLRDSSGNADYHNYAVVTVRRDTLAPGGIVVRPFIPDTAVAGSFTVRWTPGSDGLSGMQAYRVLYQTDTTAASWDTLAPFSPDTFALFNGAVAGHWYRFEAVGCDSAYNWEPLTGVPEQSVFVRDTFDTMPPTVSVIAPDTGAFWQTQAWQQISWNANDNVGVVRRELYYRALPDTDWIAIDTIYGARTNPDTFSWYVPAVLSVQAKVKVVAYDGAGLWRADTSGFFTLGDSIPPVVYSIIPASNDSAVGVLVPIEVDFSEAIQDTSFHYTLYPATGGLQATWSPNHYQVTLAHQPFKPGTSYAFTVTGARDLAGNQLVGSGQSLFTARQQRTFATSWPAGRYRLFSLPMAPIDTTAVGVLEPSLGQYSDSTWRMFDLDAQRQQFDERPLLRPGHGYWLASARGAALGIPGTSNDSVPTAMELWPGWNLVGDPFSDSLKLGRLNIIDDAGHHHYYYQSGTALNDSIVRQRMWRYDDNTANLSNDGNWIPLNATDTAAYLVPWQGYAVYAVRHCIIDYLPFGGKQAPQDKAVPPEITWRAVMDASNVGGADRGLEVGLSPQAQVGYDRQDAEKPPLVSDEIKAVIPHPEWRQGPCSGYQYDYRPAAGYVEWPLAVTQRDGERTGTLRFRTEGSLGAGQRAYLVDRKLGTATEIKGGAAVNFTGSREFAIICTDQSLSELRLKPLTFGLERLYPNPFAGQAVISYQVPAGGKVSLKVYNIAGQLVATLVDGEQAAGYYAAWWNGKSEGRYRAASGVYLVRLAYGGQTRTEKLVKVQ